MSMAIALLLKPLFLFVLTIPGSLAAAAIRRWMKPGKLKDRLLHTG